MIPLLFYQMYGSNLSLGNDNNIDANADVNTVTIYGSVVSGVEILVDMVVISHYLITKI